MDKNVGSVDLEELKKAREELNRERGIETDPHMYDNYNPDRENNTSETLSEDFSDDDQIKSQADESSPDNDDSTVDSDLIETEKLDDDLDTISQDDDRDMTPSEKNFDLYDSFSDFEVESNSVQEDDEEDNEDDSDDEKSVLLLDEEDSKGDADDEKTEKEELDEFLEDVYDGKNDDEFVVDSLTDDTDNFDFDNQDKETIPENENEDVSLENDKSESLDAFDSFKAFEVKDNMSEEDNDSSEVVADLKKLNEMLEEDDKKQEELERLAEEEIIEKNKNRYSAINSFEFIETIATGEFKNSDKLSFVLGKDENDKIVYSNIRDVYNIALFGTNKEQIFKQLSTIILSLSLKNNQEEINFVICDSKASSQFDVFNDSSYLFFNRVAKTNKEIIDSLASLTQELEDRYKKLVQFGVKSIEEYNAVALENELTPMPYILTVFSNYTKASQLASAGKINNALINMVKLGRLVGLYLILNADFEISNGELDVNFPTRIVYKTQTDEDSISAVGETGAEFLPEGKDILYYNVFERAPRHIKTPDITVEEIKLIIENNEN